MTRWSLAVAALAVVVLHHPTSASFVTFESGQVRPLAMSGDGMRLYAVDTPDDRLEIFDVDPNGVLSHAWSVPVGLEPVAVAVRANGDVWVVNQLSDSVSIVDVASTPPHVKATLLVGDEPRDIVFAGTAGRAFITTAHRGQQRNNLASGLNGGDPQLTTPGIGRADVWVFDPNSLGTSLGGTPLRIFQLFADTPRALTVSPNGNTVYAAAFHSGNRTTTLSEGAVCNGGWGAAPCTINDGSVMPGGLPSPNRNAANSPGAPETGLIVRFNGANNRWEDRKGRNWNPAIRFSLPDKDVFAINANFVNSDPNSIPATCTPPTCFSGVGTILFNMIADPVTPGKLYVSNTEARNEVRFEGPGTFAATDPNAPAPYTVRGHLHEARITVISGTTVTPHHLNKHLDVAASYAQPGATAAGDSIATPLGMAISSDGSTLYVAGFGSSKIGVYDTGQLDADTFTPGLDDIPLAPVAPLLSAGPTGMVLDESRGRLFVFTRFDNSIRVVDTGSRSQVGSPVAIFNPEPASVRNGRPFLYDAVTTSGNGEASCSACHVFADFDSLAWDLGNPDDVPLNDLNPFVSPFTPAGPFHPLKGPMTTQSLRGMVDSGPMHWRGDRSGANTTGMPADAQNEDLDFKRFIIAFDGLLGHNGPITNPQMQAFTDFILQVTYPPNPIRRLDNSLTTPQQDGSTFYFGPNSDTVHDCNGCHVLDPANAHFGTSGLMSFENEPQDFKIPHLRNAYQKVGMFGLAKFPFFRDGDLPKACSNNPTQQCTTNANCTPGTCTVPFAPPQVRGFGFLHDGSVDTLFRFHGANVFTLTNTDRANLEQFVLAFDTNLAPIVGQQLTLTSTNGATVGARLTNLFIPRAAAGDCDLVVKANVAGEQRGFLLLPNGMFQPDRIGDSLLTDAQLRAFANTAGQELTYTCVPPGSGMRIAIDRDDDSCLDGDDMDPTDPLVCAACTASTDPKAKVTVVTRKEAGKLNGKMVIALAAYNGEPISVRLSDTDSPTIAAQNVGALPPSGGSGKRWQFRTKADGLQKVVLKDLAPRQPGMFKVQVKSKHWFSAADANQPAANTTLSVMIGTETCATHEVTKKSD